MKRIDRLIGEARLMRIRRAAKARGMAVADGPRDWLEEADSARLLLEDLSEGALAEASPEEISDRRRRGAIDVLDVGILAPFVDAFVVEVAALVARMDPIGLLVADLHARMRGPEAAGKAAGTDATSGDRVDFGRVRATALGDVAILALEHAMIEGVRRLHEANDLGRIVVPSSDPASIVVEGGRAKRRRKVGVAIPRARRPLFRAVTDGPSPPEDSGA